MNGSHRIGLFGWLMCCAMVAGCATTDGVGRGPAVDSLSVLKMRPSSPAVLAYNQQLMVDVSYRLVSSEEGLLLVRPFTEGRQTRSYMAHPALRVQKGKGKVTGFFSLAGDSKVDEVRVTLIDSQDKTLLATHSSSIDAVWADTEAP